MMNSDIKGKSPTRAADADLGRSQIIFVAVGVAIILGGLWFLYSGGGPYHPADQTYQEAAGS